MSASRRAPKPRYVLTQDRDRTALVAGAACGFLVMAVSMLIQRHAILETIFRAVVAMVVVYAVVRPVLWLVSYLLETQSVAASEAPEAEVEEPNPE